MTRNKQQALYIFSDLLAAACTWILFCVLRNELVGPWLVKNVSISYWSIAFWSISLLYLFLCVVIYYFSGYYLKTFRKDRLAEIMTTLLSSFIVTSFVFVFLLLHKSFQLNHTLDFAILFYGMHFGFTYAFRLFISQYRQAKIQQGFYKIPVLIIGTGNNALKTYNELKQQQPKYGWNVAGFVALDNSPVVVDSTKILGTKDEIPDFVKMYRIEEFYVSVDDADENVIVDTIRDLYPYNKTIKIWPRLYELLTGRVKMNDFNERPFVNITDVAASDWVVCCKRGLDFACSLLFLILLMPLCAYIALKIKLDSAGPIFYKQERIGLHGKPFRIIKFRTMKQNSENGTPLLSCDNDERITSYGKILRKYRLDELPQFVNILKGDMSIVGPRPERKYFIDRIVLEAPHYYFLYRVRPGLASWGPIKVGYTDTMNKMIERLNYDIVYLDNISLVSDLKILLYTISVLIKGKGI